MLVALVAGVGGPALPAQARAVCNPSMRENRFFTATLPDRPWPLLRLQPERVWPASTGKGVLVAVIDSGVSTQTPVLAGKVNPGVDLIDPSLDGRCDTDFHGTLVAGLIVGRQVPGSAFHGIAPDAQILPIRVYAPPDPNQQPSLM